MSRRGHWLAPVKTAVNLRVTQKSNNFSTIWNSKGLSSVALASQLQVPTSAPSASRDATTTASQRIETKGIGD